MRASFVFTIMLLVGAFVLFLSQLGMAAEGLGPDAKLLAPILFHQLAVFPVVRKGAADSKSANYLSLSDGIKQKLVAVNEAGAGGQVNRVNVENKSDRALLLLGGEVILGGQQDRILGQDTLIPAHEKMVVEVFCVEHGRWSGKREFSSGHSIADGKLRVRAKFKSDQQAVWSEVAKKNASLSAAPSTGTYRNLAVGVEGDKAKKPYRDHLTTELGKLPEQKELIGLVAAVNGRVTSVDVFANPSLFSSYKEQLVDSIVMSAADVAAVPPAKPATAADVSSFIDQAEAAPPVASAPTKSGRTVKKSGKGVLNSTVESDDKKPIYKSYQADE